MHCIWVGVSTWEMGVFLFFLAEWGSGSLEL